MKTIFKIFLATITLSLFASETFAKKKYILVAHGLASDSFWNAARNGMDNACAQVDADCSYRGTEVFSVDNMIKLMEQALAEQPDGIGITIPDAAGLADVIRKAVATGIPVVGFNAGFDTYQDLGVHSFVGQDEYEAGMAAGSYAATFGGSNAICLNHQVGHSGLDDRCNGFTAGFGGNTEVVAVDENDLAGVKSAVAAKIGDGVDFVMTLNATLINPVVVEAIEEAGLTGKVRTGTNDLSEVTLKNCAAGKVEFLIDQQQYLQGYMPIILFDQWHKYKVIPPAVPSGQNVVKPEACPADIELSAAGYR